MKKIIIIVLLIVSLALPQTVNADEPYNAWDSCATNFVKYSNNGEYCIIVEISGGTKDIQYILVHDIANRNPMIYEGGANRRFLNLYDTSRYEVYYSDYVQSLTGLGSVFSGNKIELGVRHPTTGFYAEVVRSNYGLYNSDGQLIYDANYYSEVTEIVGRPDWLTNDALTNNPYYLAVFQVVDENSTYYNHYMAMELEPWFAYFDADNKIYVPNLSDNLPDPFNIKNAFIWTDYVEWRWADLGTTLEEEELTAQPTFLYRPNTTGFFGAVQGDVGYSGIKLENAEFMTDPIKSYHKLILYNWTYGEDIVYTGLEGTTPTPIVKPTAAPLASPTPESGADNGVFGLGNTIKRIFLPSPDILYNEVNASKDLLMTKLHIDLDLFNPELAGRPQNVTMEIYGQTVTLLDFEQIEEVAEQARTPINIVRVFVYIFALWGLIIFIIDYFNNRGGGNNA